MRKSILLAFSLLALCGCASTAKYEKNLSSWIGASEENLVTHWGTPESSYKVSDSVKTISFIYNGGQGEYQKYWCKTTFVLKNEVVDSWKYEGPSCKAD